MIDIALPLLLLPWLLAVVTWVAFPWLGRTVGRPGLLRWLPPGLVVFGGALLWLAASDAPAGGHDARTMTFAATAAALCDARRALPDDRDAAVRAFQDRAHDSLHLLAADPALDRASAGDLLRTKESVEAAIAAGVPAGELEAPMDELIAITARALADLDVEVASCAG